MTRLKNILLAGTLVPALTLPPMGAGWAQVPGALERGGPGAGAGGPGARGGAEGVPRGGAGAEGPRGGAGGAPRPERAPAPAPRAERPEPGAAGGRAERALPVGPRGGEPGETRAGRPAPSGNDRARVIINERRGVQPPAAAERREAPARAATPVERAVPKAAERPATPGAGRITPAERAAERPATPGAGKATPAERAAERPATPGAGKATPAERAAERPATPGAGKATPAERAAERPGAPGAAGKVTPAEREAERPGAPGAAREPGTPPGGRGPAGATPGPSSRPNDPSTTQGGGFRNGQNNGGPAERGGRDDRGGERRGGISPGGAAAIGAAAGFAGGFLAATGAQSLEGIRRDRREVREDGRTYIREPGRTIVDEGGGRAFIVHDENDRFRDLGYDVRRERRGDDYVDRIDRPDGVQILTFTTQDGRMLRRVRRYRDGREVVLIDNAFEGGVRSYADDVVDLPPPRYDIPRERYAVDYGRADEGEIYDTLIAPPVARPPRRYTLDQIRYSPDIRRYVRSVDINTINFDSGSWIVPATATGKLRALGQAIKRATGQNPNSVFLIEGYTDATGNPNDNLSLSDRRAQSVAAILSKDFGVPPENLTTQGYGQQNLKVNTQGPSVENRRVVVQNITQLMADNGGNAPPPPR